MRGKQGGGILMQIPSRIIPAHAGQTRRWHSDADSQSDHPRACGANLLKRIEKGSDFGSSPRMRGKLAVHRVIVASTRIIPAHAGQTSGHPAWSVPGTDHPRACGANAQWSFGRRLQVGSSPRMRGKLGVTSESTAQQRIIPAHAGQTATTAKPCGIRSDHPRACGANDIR